MIGQVLTLLIPYKTCNRFWSIKLLVSIESKEVKGGEVLSGGEKTERAYISSLIR